MLGRGTEMTCVCQWDRTGAGEDMETDGGCQSILLGVGSHRKAGYPDKSKADKRNACCLGWFALLFWRSVLESPAARRLRRGLYVGPLKPYKVLEGLGTFCISSRTHSNQLLLSCGCLVWRLWRGRPNREWRLLDQNGPYPSYDDGFGGLPTPRLFWLSFQLFQSLFNC